MPKGTKVEEVYQALRREGKSEESAARIAQAQTGESLSTGKPAKGKENAAFSVNQLRQLFEAFKDIKTISTEHADKLSSIIAKGSNEAIMELAKSSISFVRGIARNEARRRGLTMTIDTTKMKHENVKSQFSNSGRKNSFQNGRARAEAFLNERLARFGNASLPNVTKEPIASLLEGWEKVMKAAKAQFPKATDEELFQIAEGAMFHTLGIKKK